MVLWAAVIFDLMWPIYISDFDAPSMDPGSFSIVGIIGSTHLDTATPVGVLLV